MKAIDDEEHQWHQRALRQLLAAKRNLAKGKLEAVTAEEIQKRERTVSAEELEMEEMKEKIERKRKLLIEDTNWTMRRKVNEIWAAYKDRIHEANREHKAAHDRYLAADGDILVEEEPKLIVQGISKLEPAISDDEMTKAMAAVLEVGAEKENSAPQPVSSKAAVFDGSISGNLATLGFGSSGSRKRKLSGAEGEKEKRSQHDGAAKEDEQQIKNGEEEKDKDGILNEKERVNE